MSSRASWGGGNPYELWVTSLATFSTLAFFSTSSRINPTLDGI